MFIPGSSQMFPPHLVQQVHSKQRTRGQKPCTVGGLSWGEQTSASDFAVKQNCDFNLIKAFLPTTTDKIVQAWLSLKPEPGTSSESS